MAGSEYLETKGEDFGNFFSPILPSEARKNTYLTINGQPTKVVSHSTSKTGKHGHAKCNIAGMCQITGTKQTLMLPAHQHGCYAPIVTKSEFVLQGFEIEQGEDDGYFTLFDDETQEIREDIPFHPSVDLHKEIKGVFDGLDEDGGQEVWVTILKAPIQKGSGQNFVVCEKVVSFTTKKE